VVPAEVLAANLELMVAVNQAEVVAEYLVLAVPEARQTVAAVHWKGDQRVGVVGKDLDCAAQAWRLPGSPCACPLPGVAQIVEMQIVDQVRSDHSGEPDDNVGGGLRLGGFGGGCAEGIARQNSSDVHLVVGELREPVIAVAGHK